MTPYFYAMIYEWPPSDGQSQKDDDDDGHLRNELCALWTDSRTEEPTSLTEISKIPFWNTRG